MKYFSLQVSISTNIHYDMFEEISDVKIFPACFRGPLNEIWWVTCGPRASNCPPSSKVINELYNKTLQKLSENSKRGILTASLNKEGPNRPQFSPPLIFIPGHMHSISFLFKKLQFC